MIQVKFIGGAKKSFPSGSLEIEKFDISLDNLLNIILQTKPQTTPPLDVDNILIAINGIDSSALQGMSTILKNNDVVNIIPIIHGGSQVVRFCILKKHVLAMEIAAKSNNFHLETLRENFPTLKIQAISSRFVLNRYHLEKIISLSLHSEKHNMLLSNKLEMDILMRFAISEQISTAIKTTGIQPNQNLILIAIGSKKKLDEFTSKIPYTPTDIFAKNNTFLKKYFRITQKQLAFIRSENALADILVEKAAILFR